MVALAVLLGCCIIAWSIFFVGRRIARVLWGLLIVAEKEDEQREILERQHEVIFGKRSTGEKSTDPSRIR